MRYNNTNIPAPVAQLDRASVSGTEGHTFESCRVYHFLYLGMVTATGKIGAGVVYFVIFAAVFLHDATMAFGADTDVSTGEFGANFEDKRRYASGVRNNNSFFFSTSDSNVPKTAFLGVRIVV